MLAAAALLLVLVAAMHSLLGGRRLIRPLLAMEHFPVILGSVERSRLTLWVGWHMLSITWLVLAGLLVVMQLQPAQRSPAFLAACAGLFAVCGLSALILSRGRHLSWLFFLPISLLLVIDILR